MPYKILLIEDDPDVLDFVKYALESIGFSYEFSAIHNGEEFRAKFAEVEADIIILDLMMPGITGFQICGYIRKNPKLAKTKVLAITGYDTPENQDKIFRAGADDYLAKPFELQDLVKKIKNFISEFKS
jgi:two-component system alkaline phosphatase synthesis response regulator PhoP